MLSIRSASPNSTEVYFRPSFVNSSLTTILQRIHTIFLIKSFKSADWTKGREFPTGPGSRFNPLDAVENFDKLHLVIFLRFTDGLDTFPQFGIGKVLQYRHVSVSHHFNVLGSCEMDRVRFDAKGCRKSR